MKICSKCKVNKPLDHFYKDNNRLLKVTPACKQCLKEFATYNKEKILQYQYSYYEKNKTEIMKTKSKYMKNRMKTDIQYKLKRNYRQRLSKLIKGGSKTSILTKYLGCTISEFKNYLESQFKSDMSWENYGNLWHIDHIYPLSKIDLSTEDGLHRGLHFTNHQPLYATDNIKKGNKV
jgi:hypothetical protein